MRKIHDLVRTFGTKHDDTITGSRYTDYIRGRAGDDHIYDGHDALSAASSDRLFGGKGDDFFISRGGSDEIRGGVGDDLFWFYMRASGSESTSVILGGDGEDTVQLYGFSEDAVVTTEGRFTVIEEGGTIVKLAGVEHFEFAV